MRDGDEKVEQELHLVNAITGEPFSFKALFEEVAEEVRQANEDEESKMNDKELLDNAIDALDALSAVEALDSLSEDIKNLQASLLIAGKPPAQVIHPDGVDSGEKVHE